MEVKDAQTKGEEAKQEYLQRIKENKQRILDSLKTRPSLIERHSQVAILTHLLTHLLTHSLINSRWRDAKVPQLGY